MTEEESWKTGKQKQMEPAEEEPQRAGKRRQKESVEELEWLARMEKQLEWIEGLLEGAADHGVSRSTVNSGRKNS